MEAIKKLKDNNIAREQDIIIPVIEEQLKIETKVIETGKIQITKHLKEHDEIINIPLLHEEHLIEHATMNVFVDNMPSVRQEGDTMIIPVLKEVIVKRIFLVEEIRITKKTVQTNAQETITLKQEEVTINRVPVNANEL